MKNHIEELQRERDIIAQQIEELNSDLKRNKLTEDEYNKLYDRLQDRYTRVKDEIIYILKR